jgi:peptidoglycan/xylan/chitin deacetylase (PgdA/CDA1 family)/ubiquinone/menaquinone biosynthesis C-methylase UbiE
VSPGGRPRLCPLAPLALIGLGLLQASALLAVWAPPWTAALPLVAFLGLASLAPFFPGWRLLLPVLTRGRARDAVALTFDDGPDPATTLGLLELLARRGARAAFGLVGARARAHPELVAAILGAGHELLNHSDEHDPGLMLRPSARLRRSLEACQAACAAHGVRPLLFRPPAWVVSPRLWRVLLELDLACLGASRKALDFGNRRVRGLADRLLGRVRAGDVLGLHDRAPAAGLETWLGEVDRLLAGLEARGLRVAALSEVLARPVMEPAAGAPASPVQRFYDELAEGYDQEQAAASQEGLRGLERAAVRARLPALLPEGGRVLEVGAGTGRFSLELARRAGRVVAVDLSARMLVQLERKAAAAGLVNLETVRADLHALEPGSLGAPFDLVCAFSVLEYVPDLPATLARLAGLLAPGGCLLLTTAQRSLPRLFTQLGNAMRQGVWLAARSERELRRGLAGAGLREVEIARLGLRVPGLPGFGGLLWLGVARR